MRWGDRAGLGRVTPHQLRHTSITTLALRTNGNLLALQGFARHANPRTTGVYIDNLGHGVRELQDLLGDDDEPPNGEGAPP
jgi:integrase/recombinase XerC